MQGDKSATSAPDRWACGRDIHQKQHRGACRDHGWHSTPSLGDLQQHELRRRFPVGGPLATNRFDVGRDNMALGCPTIVDLGGPTPIA